MKLPSLAAFALLATAAAAQAGTLSFATTFGPEGGNGRTGSGSAFVTFDDITHVLSYSGSFAGLSGLSSAAHFHCCTALPLQGTAGIAVDSPTLLGIPIGVSAGVFSAALDLDDPANFNATFLSTFGGTTALATARLLEGFRTSTAYLNIHSTTFGGGEIRGFLAVPEPASLALALFGLAALGSARRARRGGR